MKIQFAVIFFLTLAWQGISAQEPLRIQSRDEIVFIKNKTAVFEDKGGTANIEQIVAGAYDQQFITNTHKSLNFGYADHPVWLRFTVVKGISDIIYLKAGNPNLDTILLYEVKNGAIVAHFGGSSQQAREKEIYSNDQFFRLDQEPGELKTWYLRIQANLVPEQFDGSIATLKAQTKNHIYDSLLFGIYAGLIILICLFSLFLLTSFKDITFLYYILYNLFFLNMMCVITGFYGMFYPPAIIETMNTYFSIANLIWLLFLTAFITKFLELKTYAPSLIMVSKAIYVISIGFIILAFAGFSATAYRAFEYLAIISSVFYIGAGILCHRRGYKFAKYYLAGSGSLIILGIIVIITNIGFHSFDDPGYHGLKLGHALEVIFFSLGLTQRAALLNRDKIEAQNKYISQLQETSKQISERNKVEMLFGQQVSKEIVQQLVSMKGEFQSQYMDVTVLFLDIRDFTPYTETHTPEEVIQFQNTVFSIFINIVEEHKGIINTLLGDGLMATFGAPFPIEGHCEKAVTAGLQMIREMKELSSTGLIFPTRIGIGIHTGQVVAGNIGNDIRKEFSLSGMTVIKAARLEQLNKKLGTEMLISKDVYDRINGLQSEMKSFGKLRLKGIEKPVEVFTLKDARTGEPT